MLLDQVAVILIGTSGFTFGEYGPAVFVGVNRSSRLRSCSRAVPAVNDVLSLDLPERHSTSPTTQPVTSVHVGLAVCHVAPNPISTFNAGRAIVRTP